MDPVAFVIAETVASTLLIGALLLHNHLSEKDLRRQIAEAMRLLASPGYQAYATGKNHEAKSSQRVREPTEHEIRAAAEEAILDAAESDPYSQA